MLHDVASRLLSATTDGDLSGWIAALIGAVCIGSYGVPIKETMKIDVHPLVLQSYKSAVFFVSVWAVRLSVGGKETPRFTPWGLLSGLLWVAGGTGGIVAIRNAGMAIAVGTWSSVMVLVNFVFGILVFEEPVHSLHGAFGGFFTLALGLIGMSVYSAPPPPSSPAFSSSSRHRVCPKKPQQNTTEEQIIRNGPTIVIVEDKKQNMNGNRSSSSSTATPVALLEDKPRLSKRHYGVLCAIWNGIVAGSTLIPLHYAKREGFTPASYVASFSTGTVLATLLYWALFLLYNYYCRATGQHPPNGGTRIMPTCHCDKLFIRGSVAGLLIAIGMLCSIHATGSLGQGIGNSLVQSKILISGLWGIFWYREIRGKHRIARWFASAMLAVSGILWLTYERVTATRIAKGGTEITSDNL